MRTFLRWTTRIALVLVVLLVVAILMIDTLARVLAERRLQAQTGMRTEIAAFKIGLRKPHLTIEGIKLYNPPEFGESLFLHLPEMHFEYDRNALSARKLDLPVVRFHLNELNVVVNQAGQTNLMVLKEKLEKAQRPTKPRGSTNTPPEFLGIGELTLSLGKINYIDLRDAQQNRTLDLGLRNEKFSQIKTLQDLGFQLLAVLLKNNVPILNLFMGGVQQLPRPAELPAATNAPPPSP